MDADLVWGALFMAYIFGGGFWAGALDSDPLPRHQHPESATYQAWRARVRTRDRRLFGWGIGFALLLGAWIFFAR